MSGLSRSFVLLFLFPTFMNAAAPHRLASPDGQLVAEFSLSAEGVPTYALRREGRLVLEESRLGLLRNDAAFSKDLRETGRSPVEAIEDDYEILTAKRRQNRYRAHRTVWHLENAAGQKLDIVFQASNDGLAFRYRFPESSPEARTIREELTSFHFAAEAKAWLQPMQVAKTGFESTNPAYEEYYEKDIPVGTPSPLGAGWVYPALFRTGENWVLISEGSLGRGHSATRLRHESPGGEYRVGFPDERETMNGAPVTPVSKLPWQSPWRLVVAGSLPTIAESTLGIDLAEEAKMPRASWMKPGRASWSWPLLGDGSANYQTQKEFIDYAAEMGWEYCLIDAWWDKQIGFEKMQELVDYAAAKKVGILLWYNSAGDWNTVKMTPRNQLLTHEDRVREFGRLRKMGVKGLKVDFFGGDGQAVINYYLDLLEDSAPFELLVNFHGSTLPRGWQRTYPHLMTMEGIKGLEFITFEQDNANQEPTHAPMLPFTRNVFDPMDFTPMAMDRLNDKVTRRTTSAFELALSVLFTSGIQHYAEIPAGMAKAPDYVRDFLKAVPGVWDDTKFIDGFPGKFVALARRGHDRWYVAGINGESEAKVLELDLSELGLPENASGILITDGDGGNMSFERETVFLKKHETLTVKLPAAGGFVLLTPASEGASR